MLANLAEDQEDIPSSIDSNSILGSQKSQFFQDFPLVPEDLENIEDEEEEQSDLNITNLELDTLNLSSWETMRENSQALTHKTIGSQFGKLFYFF